MLFIVLLEVTADALKTRLNFTLDLFIGEDSLFHYDITTRTWRRSYAGCLGLVAVCHPLVCQ